MPHDTDGLKDCGVDATCFLAALEDGKPVKVLRKRTLSGDGASIVETDYEQISNFTDDQCTLFVRLEDVTVTLTDDARAKLRQQGVTDAEINRMPDEARQAVGRELACLFDKAALLMLTRLWNQAQMSVEDFMRADHCEGDFAPMGASFIPRIGMTRTGRSWWLLEAGKIEEAEQLLRLAFTADPAYEQPDAHQRMGQIYLRQKKVDAALDEFLKAVELNPLHNSAWSDVGLAYELLGNVEKAAEQYRRQVGANRKNGMDNSSRPYARLCALSGNGPVETIVEVCEAARKKDDADPLPWNSLAWTYAASKDPRYRDPVKALEYAQKAVALDQGKTPEILDTLAEAYFVNGNVDKAIETERKALALSSDKAPYDENLARYLRAKNGKR